MKIKIRLLEDVLYNVKQSLKYDKTYKKFFLYVKNKEKFKDRVKTAIEYLSKEQGYSLDPSYKFHYFGGQHGNNRGDVHIAGDIVLVFQYDRKNNILNLEYITNHSNMKERLRYRARLLEENPIIKKIKSFKTEEGTFSIWDINDNHRNRADMFTVHEDKNGWIIRNALVPDELQKQGMATNFYIKMNELSKKKTNKPLRSTQPRKLNSGEIVHELSELGQKLWDSLVNKGLAIKISDKNYQFK